jgi:hypothetical protein
MMVSLFRGVDVSEAESVLYYIYRSKETAARTVGKYVDPGMVSREVSLVRV